MKRTTAIGIACVAVAILYAALGRDYSPWLAAAITIAALAEK